MPGWGPFCTGCPAGNGGCHCTEGANTRRCHPWPQSGPLAGLRSVGLDVLNATPAAKGALLRLAMQGLGGGER